MILLVFFLFPVSVLGLCYYLLTAKKYENLTYEPETLQCLAYVVLSWMRVRSWRKLVMFCFRTVVDCPSIGEEMTDVTVALRSHSDVFWHETDIYSNVFSYKLLNKDCNMWHSLSRPIYFPGDDVIIRDVTDEVETGYRMGPLTPLPWHTFSVSCPLHFIIFQVLKFLILLLCLFT